MSVTQESAGHAISKYVSLTVRQRISGSMDQLCQSRKVHYPATSCMYYITKYNAIRSKISIITFTDDVEVDNCKNELLGEDDLDAEKYALTVFRPSEYCTCGINRKSKWHLNVRAINWFNQVKKIEYLFWISFPNKLLWTLSTSCMTTDCVIGLFVNEYSYHESDIFSLDSLVSHSRPGDDCLDNFTRSCVHEWIILRWIIEQFSEEYHWWYDIGKQIAQA